MDVFVYTHTTTFRLSTTSVLPYLLSSPPVSTCPSSWGRGTPGCPDSSAGSWQRPSGGTCPRPAGWGGRLVCLFDTWAQHEHCTWRYTETAAGTDLYGEDKHSTAGHHVEEEDHGFILVRGVGVKYPLGHHMTLTHTHTQKTWLISLSSLFRAHFFYFSEISLIL